MECININGISYTVIKHNRHTLFNCINLLIVFCTPLLHITDTHLLICTPLLYAIDTHLLIEFPTL